MRRKLFSGLFVAYFMLCATNDLNWGRISSGPECLSVMKIFFRKLNFGNCSVREILFKFRWGKILEEALQSSRELKNCIFSIFVFQGMLLTFSCNLNSKFLCTN